MGNNNTLIRSTLNLLDTNFVPLGDNERDAGSLAVDETDNGKDLMSFIA